MQNYKSFFKDETVYIGIDVHLKQWHVCIRTKHLSPKPFSQPASAEALRSYLDCHFPGGDYCAAHEIGFSGFSIHYELERLGIRSIVFNPADICDTQKERSRKTDAVDCRKICRNLMNGDLTPIYVPSQAELSDRGFLRAYDNSVKLKRLSKQRIKSLLHRNGVSYPEAFEAGKGHWSRRFMQWLAVVEDSLGGGEGYRLHELVEDHNYAHSQFLRAGRAVCDVIKKKHFDKDRLLRSVPGIGRVTSSRFCLELPDIHLFKNSDHLAGYVGLVPDVRVSDDHIYVRGVTHRGKPLLRSSLIESAWRAIVVDPALGAAYTKYIKRGIKPNNAIVRIARKLLNRIHFVLREEKMYERGRER